MPPQSREKHNMLTINAFIKWTSSDEDGAFTHVGQITSINDDNTIEFVTANGTIHVDLDDGTFAPARKPRKWGVVEITPAPAKTRKNRGLGSIATKTVRKVRKQKSGSKLEQIVTLLKNNPPANRKDAIAKIVEAGLSTQAGASTQYNTAKGYL